MTFSLMCLFVLLVFWQPQDWLSAVAADWRLLPVIMVVAMVTFLAEMKSGRIRMPKGVMQPSLLFRLWIATIMSNASHFYYQGTVATRAGMKLISLAADPLAPRATYSISAALTRRPSSWRSRFSSRILVVNGRLETLPTPLSSRLRRRRAGADHRHHGGVFRRPGGCAADALHRRGDRPAAAAAADRAGGGGPDQARRSAGIRPLRRRRVLAHRGHHRAGRLDRDCPHRAGGDAVGERARLCAGGAGERGGGGVCDARRMCCRTWPHR